MFDRILHNKIMTVDLILVIFAFVKPIKINQNANWLSANQILIFVAHMKEHFCMIKMTPNTCHEPFVSRTILYFPKKSSGKIIIGVIQSKPPAANANANADKNADAKNGWNANAM